MFLGTCRLVSDECSRQYLLNLCVRNRNVETYNRAARRFELLMIKHGILYVADEFLSRVSILTRDSDIAILSVCLSVRLSVTFRYQMKTA